MPKNVCILTLKVLPVQVTKLYADRSAYRTYDILETNDVLEEHVSDLLALMCSQDLAVGSKIQINIPYATLKYIHRKREAMNRAFA